MNKRLRRWLKTLTGVVLVLLMLWGARSIERAGPSEAAMFGPFLDTGAVGDTVSARLYSMKVLGVRGAGRILVDSYSGKYADTAGVFVLVKTRVIAKQESTYVKWIILRDGAGRSYEPTERTHQPMSVSVFDPGVPIEGEWVFEVPKSAATSLTILLSDSLSGDDDLMATIGAVSLSIADTDVAGWLASDDPASPEQALVVA